MKIYIASKYIEHSELNQKIYNILTKNGFDAFLPKSINIEGKTKNEMEQIAYKCYNAIDSCDTILVVSPIGRSVSAEIGYAIYKKVKFSDTTIIQFRYTNKDKEKEDYEAMITPFYDYSIENKSFNNVNESLNDLLTLLNSINIR